MIPGAGVTTTARSSSGPAAAAGADAASSGAGSMSGATTQDLYAGTYAHVSYVPGFKVGLSLRHRVTLYTPYLCNTCIVLLQIFRKCSL